MDVEVSPVFSLLPSFSTLDGSERILRGRMLSMLTGGAFRLVVLELVALQLGVLLVLGRRRRRVGIGVVSDDEISMRERKDCLGVITYLLM